MTTIAYKNGIIATDGQVTCGDVILTLNQVKRQEFDGKIFFLCGANSSMKEFMKAYPDKRILDSNNSGFCIDGGVLFATVADGDEVCTWEHRSDIAWAYGSGSRFSIGAMDMGATAEESIEVARKRDSGTGGLIRTYNAVTGEEL